MSAHYGKRRLYHLVSRVRENYKGADTEVIERAFHFAKAAHKNQRRKSRRPFFHHPLQTALILANLGADTATVAAALLHDVVEDTAVTSPELRKGFGPEIASLVAGVTKLEKIATKSRKERQAANLQSLLLAATKDARVIAIKLADRLHNLRTLKYLPKDDRHRIATEALAVYTPIGLKLGIYEIYNPMGDTAFRVLRPKLYRDLAQRIGKKNKRVLREIDAMARLLGKELHKSEFVKSQKTVYRVYAKMQRTGKSLDQLQDTIGLKLICPSVMDCYTALGIVHQHFVPLPRKMKDYIAVPQSNLYQALHTTVIGPNGLPVKVYISTPEMDEIARKGVIAYWQLKDKGAGRLLDRRVGQLVKIMRQQKFPEEASEFMDALQSDFLDKTVFVFSQGGKMVELPAGATPIDFAYATNPKQAFRIWKAKVNSKFIPLGRKLKTGNIVEVVTSNEVQANSSWLKMVKSFELKAALQGFLKKHDARKKPSLDLRVKAKDHVGVLASLSKVLASHGLNIAAASLATLPDGKTECHFNLGFSKADRLRKAIEKIKKMKGIKSVEMIYRE